MLCRRARHLLVKGALEIEPPSSKPRYTGESAAARRRPPPLASTRRRSALARVLGRWIEIQRTRSKLATPVTCGRPEPSDLDPTHPAARATRKPPQLLDLDPTDPDQANQVKPSRPWPFCRKVPKFSDIHKNTLPPLEILYGLVLFLLF
jgi:hypothetical protein